MTKKQTFGLSLLLLLSALLGFGSLTSGHNWAYSDFASYIMQAESILDGNLEGFVAHNTITIEESDVPVGPIAYPWGYPLMLAPIISLMGISTLSMKLLNTLLFLLFLLTFFFLLRKRLPYLDSLLLTALFAFNPVFLEAQDSILSDLPFLFFSTFAIFLMDDRDSARPPDKIAYLKQSLIGGIIFFAFFIRTNGLLLLLSLFAYEILRLVKLKTSFSELKKQILLLATPYLTFILLWGLTSLIFPDGQASHLSHYQNFHFSQLGDYLLFYTNLGEEFFAEIVFAKIIYLLFGFFFFVGIFLKSKENILFILYFFFTVALYISWPHKQGIRFLFPILPFFFYLALQGFRVVPLKKSKIASLFPRLILAALILVFFVISTLNLRENLLHPQESNGPFDEVSIELFEYIKKTLPEKSRVVFFKPRVMRLMTDRDSILILSCENLPRGEYLVINKKWEDMGQIAPDEAKSCSVGLEKLFWNRRFILYHIAP